MEVLLFPGQQDGTDASAIRQFLMNTSQDGAPVSGATIVVQWSAVDPDGNAAHYDWSVPDGQIQPWVAVGKKVNLVVWANSDGSGATCGPPGRFGLAGVGNCAIPAYVWTALGSSNYVVCNPSNSNGPQQMPNYFSTTFQRNYQNFMAALVSHYGSNPAIGYIRFGLGRGGETIPVADWDNTSEACGQQYVTTWGYSVSSWDSNYLGPMLQFEHSLGSPKQLMVGLTSMGNHSGNQNADFAAHTAVPFGIGIGSQGLQLADVAGCSGASSDWCNLFHQYVGQVPLELQPIGESCPGGGCQTGDLTQLLPFAVANHATIFEIYYQDWLKAYDSSYPGGFDPAYAAAFQAAAAGK
jgi:hypothetical protein